MRVIVGKGGSRQEVPFSLPNLVRCAKEAWQLLQEIREGRHPVRERGGRRLAGVPREALSDATVALLRRRGVLASDGGRMTSKFTLPDGSRARLLVVDVGKLEEHYGSQRFRNVWHRV
jgi:hypothetical protein